MCRRSTDRSARRAAIICFWLVVLLSWPVAALAQPPFSTDDVGVTAKGAVHVEVFNELDWLQPEQAPHLRQNTINMRVNYGVTDRLELDVDSPLLVVFNERATDPEKPVGIDDTDFGVKLQLVREHWRVRHRWRLPRTLRSQPATVPRTSARALLTCGCTVCWTPPASGRRAVANANGHAVLAEVKARRDAPTRRCGLRP
jgi:hypothetical protein